MKDARKFIQALFPSLDGGNRIELRFLYPGTREADTIRFKDDIDDAIETSERRSEVEHLEAFFGVSARGPKKIGKKHNLTYISAFFADMDVGNDKFWKTKEEALAALEAFDLKPSIVVDSGGGYHAYWLLREPLVFGEWRCREKCPECQQKRSGKCRACRVCTAKKNPTHIPANMDRFEGVMRGLVEPLRLDNVFDATRILRMPGTTNHKPGREPRPVRMVRFSPNLRYDLDPLAERFWRPRLDENEEPTNRFFSNVVPNGKKAWSRIQKEALKPLSAHERRSLTQMVETGDARRFKHHDGTPGDVSGMNTSACKKLLRAGASYEDILAIFQEFPIGRRFEKSGQGKSYLRQIIVGAEASLERDRQGGGGKDKGQVTFKRQQNFNDWVWSTAPAINTILKALPGTVNNIVNKTTLRRDQKPRSRPWVEKWLKLAIEMGWAAEGKRASSTGGKPPKVFELTEDGKKMISKTGALIKGGISLALFSSSAAQNLYLATNPVEGLDAWRKKKAALRRSLRRAAREEADFVIQPA